MLDKSPLLDAGGKLTQAMGRQAGELESMALFRTMLLREYHFVCESSTCVFSNEQQGWWN